MSFVIVLCAFHYFWSRAKILFIVLLTGSSSTDGVTEAMDGEGQLYTKGRLKETLDRAGTPDAKAEQILAAVRADIAAHVGGAEQSDDVTMMAVRFLG